MQAGGRCRDRPFGAGEHRLVIAAVARIAARRPLDIRRQRHRAIAAERSAKRRALDGKTECHVAFHVLRDDGRGEIRRELDRVAGSEPLRAFGKGAPGAAALVMVQGQFDPCRAAATDKPPRDDLGVVAHQQVPGPQQLRQIGDMPVGKRADGRDHQQPRRFARLAWTLGNQLAR
jgi:hypothetical protein